MLLFPEPKFENEKCQVLIDLVERATLSWQIAGKNAQELEDHFHALAWSLNDESPTFENIELILQGLIPEFSAINSELTGPITDSTLSRVLLFRIHQFLGDIDRIIPYDTDKTDVEHIAPVKSTVDWLSALNCTDDDEGHEKYSDIVELIGNKTLLEQAINNSLRQRPFSDKKAGFVITQEKEP